ncbi:hypothetical protein FSP39_017356 [Pinctada imbricata]|uniref:Transglutaminase-like domain-containing protein n=1 Tax=Pinctada imbricata TaxID=66713 RepID=A0AA88XJB6_PINIB|nr:hypothetical protein FSP39_017356 [Pinctada imbricata]
MFGTFPLRRPGLWADDPLFRSAFNVHKNHIDHESERPDERDISPFRRYNNARSSGYDRKPTFVDRGTNPKPGKGTHVQCLLSTVANANGWAVILTGRLQRKTEAVVAITTPPDCIVGDWKLTIENVVQEGGKPVNYKYEIKTPIYVLFNPWCKEDDVYFDSRDLLEEYLLNDSGVIFNGNYKQIGAKPWFYGQFEDQVLEAALFCVQRGFSGRYGHQMADPVRVNSNDDNGVLVGRWSEPYVGGKSPMTWNGSVAILRQYLQNRKPVKFGQCFVFAGIVTTICRALGIACRTVSNFASAHDLDGSVTVDIYWDTQSGSVLKDISDQIWNFHCWNDVWMRRKDLPSGYGGWQTIDATPQERSEGMFQLGPTSLRAVREGKCELPHDGPFLFAEVNGDKINWGKSTDGQWYILNLDKTAIGKKISTKLPDGKPVRSIVNSLDVIRQDITDEYKYPDESERERHAVIAASRASLRKNNVYNNEKQQDVKITGFRDRDWILIGRNFSVDLMVKNTSFQRRTLEGKIICETITYTGEWQAIIKEHSFNTVIGPNAEGEVSMQVRASDYLDRLTEHASMKVSAMLKVLETGQVESWQDDFLLRKPELNLEVSSEKVFVGKPFECRVSFTNPLSRRPLTGCSITIEGPGLDSELDYPLGVIEADREWAAILSLTPSKPGRRQITVNFNSDQIRDINGATDVFVV